MTNNLDEPKFTQLSKDIYLSEANCNNLSIEQILEKLNITIDYSYARKIIAFVRQLQDNCFYSLPDGVQKAVIWIEDNHADEAQNKDIADKLGVSNYHIRLAKLFIAMENMGLFDEPGVYDF